MNFEFLKACQSKLLQTTMFAILLAFLFIIVSKGLLILNEELLVVVSFLSFVYFIFIKINDLTYLELVSRNEKLFREADLFLFNHQKIINAILEIFKTSFIIQNELKNDYIFFRYGFFTNLWPCKGFDFLNANLHFINTILEISNQDFQDNLQKLENDLVDSSYLIITANVLLDN